MVGRLAGRGFLGALVGVFFLVSAQQAGAATNLVLNGDFETTSSNASIPAHWNKDNWGTLTATYAYPVTGNGGGKAAKVTVTNYRSGDAKWAFTELPATAGEKYTYSSTFFSTAQTHITVAFKMSNGSYQYQWLGSLAASSAWKPYTKEIIIPSGAVAFTVYHLISRNGSLTIDNVSITGASSTTPPPPPPSAPTCTLSASPATILAGATSTLSWSTTNASTTSINNGVGVVATNGGTTVVAPAQSTTYTLTAHGPGGSKTCTTSVTVTLPPPPPPPQGDNLIQNGNFETAANATTPLGWNTNYWGSLRAVFTYPTAGKDGGKAAKVTVSNYNSGDAKWWFTHIPASSHTLYRYTNDYSATVPTNVTVEFKMANGSYQYQWLSDAPAQSGWGTFAAQITVPAGATSFTIFHSLQKNGSLTIDNASVVALPAAPFAEGMVTFVFDDGLSSQYTNARPILNTASVKGVFGIITQSVGANPYMTWVNITTLKNEGHEVGGHTRTHADLTTLSAAQLQSEIQGSYDDLVANGFTPKTFIYPYGATNATVKAATQTAGYIGARGSYFGLNAPFTDRYGLYDFRLDKTTTLAAAKTIIDQAYEDKRWLVFELHDVLATGGDEYAITPTLLKGVVDYVKQKSMKVVTLEEGMGLLTQ